MKTRIKLGVGILGTQLVRPVHLTGSYGSILLKTVGLGFHGRKVHI